MKPWRVLAVVAAILVVPVASGAEWLRAGYDAGRTGAIPFEGPQTNDTAFSVQLPGSPVGEIAVVDGAAYVLTFDSTDVFEGDTDGLGQPALWRVELATGAVQRLFDVPENIWGIKALPGLAIAQDGEDLVALEVPSGEERWRTRVLEADPDVEDRAYGDPVLVGGVLYLGFSATQGAVPPEGPIRNTTDGCVCPGTGGVAALELATGEPMWAWQRSEGAPETHDITIRQVVLAADDQRVYAYVQVESTTNPPGGAYHSHVRQYETWAVEGGEGALLGNDTEQEAERVTAPVQNLQLSNQAGWVCCARPVVTSTAVHTRLDAFSALNKVGQGPIWTSPAGRTDQVRIQGATGMGLLDDAFIGTSLQTVYRLDATTGDLVWSKTDPTSGKLNSVTPVALDEGNAYIPTVHNISGFSGPGLDARDLETGELKWSWRHLPAVGLDPEQGTRWIIPAEPAFAPGLAVVGAKDGTVHIVGETQASIGPFLIADERYPPVGQNATVDLSGTGPGAFGPPTRYRVFWGDGTVSPWQASPIFHHAYNETENVTARLQAGNEANQTASTFVTMRVGAQPPIDGERYPPVGEPVTINATEAGLAQAGDEGRYRVFWGDGTVSPWQASPVFDHTYEKPGNTTARIQVVDASNQTASAFIAMHVGMDPPPVPPEPNLLQEAFARENQDMTFGILGILVAVTGGAIGVASRYRKRSRLQDELEALDEGYQATKANPGECEAFLDTRKARARSLLLDGELNEEQFGVVERRIAELHTELRTSVLDERFQFLPHGMVQSIKKMLADGRLSSWEREALARLLDEHDELSPAQKERVRDQLDRWFGQDGAGA